MAEKQGVGELFDLVKAYAKQETIEPLRILPRWLGFGLLGSALLMIGGATLSLALLRFLQEEGGSAMTGNLSWLPYLITVAAVSVAIIVLGLRIKKRSL